MSSVRLESLTYGVLLPIRAIASRLAECRRIARRHRSDIESRRPADRLSVSR